MARSRMTASVARWSATHPWRALLIWVLFVAGAVAAGSSITTNTTTDEDYRLGSSGRAEALIDDAGLAGVPTENVLITAPHGALDVAAATQVAHGIGADMQSGRGRRPRCDDPIVSDDKKALLLPIQLARDRDGEDVDVQPLLDITAQLQQPSTKTSTSPRSATPRSTWPSTTGSAEDLATAETLSLPITLGDHADRVRRPDRSRHPGAAGDLRRGGDDRALRADLASDPGRGHRRQHGAADRDGRRRRLLAVLSQA